MQVLFFKVEKFITISYLFLLAICFLSLAGCQKYNWTEINPMEHEKPILLFDRYLLDLYGSVNKFPTMSIEVRFLKDITDTTHLDTIPILILDSLCFYSNCMGFSFCSKLLNWVESNKYLRIIYPYLEDVEPSKPFRDTDLWYRQGKLIPDGFNLDPRTTWPIPESCFDTTITVEIRATLLDRITGDILCREMKTIEVQFIHKKQLRVLS